MSCLSEQSGEVGARVTIFSRLNGQSVDVPILSAFIQHSFAFIKHFKGSKCYFTTFVRFFRLKSTLSLILVVLQHLECDFYPFQSILIALQHLHTEIPQLNANIRSSFQTQNQKLPIPPPCPQLHSEPYPHRSDNTSYTLPVASKPTPTSKHMTAQSTPTD